MRKVLLVATVLWGFIACSPLEKKKFPDAMAYDQFIIDHMDQMQQTLFAVQRVTGSDSANLQAVLSDYTTQIDSAAKIISNLPDFNGNTDYRDAAVRLAEFYKKSINGPYIEIEKIYKEVQDTALANSRVDAIIAGLQKEETKADDDFIAKRNAFAIKNNMKIAAEIPAQ